MAATLHAVHGLMLKAGLREALRFTACLTDGTDLYAFRWASDGRAPTLYWRQTDGNLVVVSEPLDGDRKRNGPRCLRAACSSPATAAPRCCTGSTRPSRAASSRRRREHPTATSGTEPLVSDNAGPSSRRMAAATSSGRPPRPIRIAAPMIGTSLIGGSGAPGRSAVDFGVPGDTRPV